MRPKDRSNLCNFIGVLLDSLKNFLLNNRCDAACLLLNTHFEKNECIGTGFCFVYFVDGIEKSKDFDDEVYGGDVFSLIREGLPALNSNMKNVSGKFWDYMVITMYKDGRISIRFFYDFPPGEHMRHRFSV